ncbi:MAG: 7TM diverse intracellular signaling domain-containing protein, partial [Chitinophagaceae bacterium]
MRKGILLGIVYFLLLNQAEAQTNLPPAYEIKTDTAFMQVVPDSLWQILEDKEGDWTIENVNKPPLFDKFHFTGVQAQGIDTNKIHTYWQRFRLKNDMNVDAKISLTAPVDYYDVYVIRNDSLPIHFTSGLLQDWDKKDGLKAALYGGAISLVLKPGDETLIYTRKNRVNTTNYKRGVYFYNTEKLIQQEYIDKVDSRETYFGKIHLQESFVLGLLLLAIFLNIFFYRIVHEKVYLYFALFALFLGFNRLWNLSNTYTVWEHPAWREYVPILSYAWAFIPYYLIQFFRQFLQTKTHYPKWDKFLYSLAVGNMLVHGLTIICLLFFSSYVKYFYNILSILPFFLIPICIIITFFLFINKKGRPIRYLI